MRKTTLYIATLATGLMLIMGTTAQAQSWLARYYEKNPTSLASIKAAYGEPLNVIALEDGVQKMIFGPKDVEMGYTYFLIKDNQRVIDKGMCDSLEKQPKKIVFPDPEPEGILARYYSRHPMTVAQLKARWGEPIRVHEYDNGVTKMVFGPETAELGCTYFLIKDGMVADRNTTAAD